MASLKGQFFVKHSEGTTKLAGNATLTNDTPSISVRDDSPIEMHKDASGVFRSVTRDQIIDSMSLRLVPGRGSALANQAAVIAAVASVRKFDQLITALFKFDILNWPDSDKAVLTDIQTAQGEGADGELNVSAARYKTNAGVTIDFTGNWAAI